MYGQQKVKNLLLISSWKEFWFDKFVPKYLISSTLLTFRNRASYI